jgi:uncharacterized protein YndB with AHSA1/START domain
MRDFVQREIVIQGPVDRVFAALIDPSTFPTWGPEAIEGDVAPGARPILDFGPAGGGKVRVYVVAVEPPRRFAYRWAQGATDPAVLVGDPLAVPNTLVEFLVDEVEGGTRVRVVESGISKLPGMEAAGDDAVENMGKGWELMLGGLSRSFSADGALRDRIENDVVIGAPRADVYDALVHPERWWAQTVDGAFVPGGRVTMDFGPFGTWTVDVVEASAPHHLTLRKDATVIEYHLDDAPGGTRLRHAESGFLALPEADRKAAFTRSLSGWGIILGLLQMHFAGR